MRSRLIALAALALFSPQLAHADAVHDALEAYALYQHDVSALLDSDINGAPDVDAAVARLSRHNPERVARGWIAYGALTAAQSPAFAEGVRRDVRDTGRAPVLAQLRANTQYARQAETSQAVQLILGAASADSVRVSQAGARFERFARTAAAQPAPSGESDQNGAVRLSASMRDRLRVTAVSTRPMSEVDDFGGRAFWDSFSGRDANTPRARTGREQRSFASVTDHMLTIAALVVADAAGGERRRVATLLDEPLTQQCMVMERLQLRQCLSVSVDASERAYCLGRHGLSGPGDCFSSVVR